MKKKAQGLPLNTIVIAVIVLLVLVVLIYVFSEQIRDFILGVKSCTVKGGTCEASCTAGQTEVGASDCKDLKPKCCVTIFETEKPKTIV